MKLTKKIVFFDLDGTLHKQNMFGYFIIYLLRYLPINIFLVISILPIVVIGFLIKGRLSRWPMSILLWSITFGHKEKKLKFLQENFSIWFRNKVNPLYVVQQKLYKYLSQKDIQVFIITGSPEILVDKVYKDSFFLSKVIRIGSKIQRKFCGWTLNIRCLGKEKVKKMEHFLGIPLNLYSGYSDSINDAPLLSYCKFSWKVTKDGNIKKIKKN